APAPTPPLPAAPPARVVAAPVPDDPRLGMGVDLTETRAPVAPLPPAVSIAARAMAPVAPAPILPGPVGFAANHDLVAFVSDRDTSGAGGFDIYLYDATLQTVWAPPGVNSKADEANPSLAHGNQWLVYASNAAGNFDIRRFDMTNQLIDGLGPANTAANEVSPTINEAGTVIAYTSDVTGSPRLHLFDLRTGANYVPAAVARLCGDIFNPYIAADSSRVAFSSPVKGSGLDLFVYDMATAAVWTPPFVNSAADEDEPVLSPVDARMLFSTNRNGNFDVMLTDLHTGFLDGLALANSKATELTPGFLGAHADRILYVSDRTGKGDRRMLVYAPALGLVDTLPVAHDVGSEDTFSPP
ncbi:MAG: hypothetical protein JWM80_2475, partial [Cyanobacteria bacterium RYN_339]|nr:hypothetical protein [Cyanobacteria bacterium RYN_339]